MKESTKKRIMDKKWARLEREGIKRPKTPEENRKRIREAHSGIDPRPEHDQPA